MANKQINIGINFDVNQQALKSLESSLQGIINKARQSEKILPDYAGALTDAAEAAQDFLNILKEASNQKLGTINWGKVSKGINELYGDTKNFKSVLNEIGPEGQSAFNQIAKAITATEMPIKRTNKLLDQMADTFQKTVRYGIASSVWNNFSNSVSKAYSYVRDLDKSLNDIRIVSGQSAQQMEKLAIQANKTAQALGTSTLDYTKAALIYYQQGLDSQQVEERTAVTLKMANVLGTTASEVSNYMTAIWNNFDDGSESLEHYADVITALGAATASSSEEIAEGLEKFAAIGKTVGLSYEYATSALATVVAQTRQSADTVGTAFKTLFARIQDLELGKTLEDGTTLGKYSKALETIGVNIKDQAGNLKDMNTILDEMGSKWKTLSSAQQVALAQTVGGTRQYSQLVAMMSNWDKVKMNLDIANSSEGTLNEKQQIYLDSLDAHLQRLSASWEGLYKNLFDEETVKFFADTLTNIINLVNQFVTGLGGGLNSLIYLTLTLTNIFSTQLAKEIDRVTSNLKEWKRFAHEQEMAKELADEFKNLSLTDVSTGNKTIEEMKKEIDLNLQLLDIKSNLDQKGQKEINEILELNDALEDELKIWKQITNLVKHPNTDRYEELGGPELIPGPNVKNPNAWTSKAQQNYLEQYYKDNNISLKERVLGDLQHRIKANTQKKDQMSGILNKIQQWDELNDDEKQNNLNNSKYMLTQQEAKIFADTAHDIWRAVEKLQKKVKQYEESGKGNPEEIEQLKEGIKKFTTLGKALNQQYKDKKTGEFSQDLITKTSDLSLLKDSLLLSSNRMDYNNDLYEKGIRRIKDKKELSEEICKNEQKTTETLLMQNQYAKENIVNTEKRVEALDNTLKTLTMTGTTISSILGMFKTFTSDMSIWDKISTTFTVLGPQMLMIAKNWNSIKTGFKDAQTVVNGITASLELQNAITAKRVVTEGAITAEKATQQKITFSTFLTDMKDFAISVKKLAIEILITIQKSLQKLISGEITGLGVAAAAALAVAAVALVKWTYDLMNTDFALERINKKIAKATENLEKVKKEFDDISQTFNSYSEAVKNIDEMTSGTIEFYEAIQKANEEAEKLIEELNLVAGVDYGIGKNGLIEIKEDRLNEKMFQEQQKVYRAQSEKYKAQLELEQHNQEILVNQFRDRTGTTLWKMNKENAQQILADPSKDVSGNVSINWSNIGHILSYTNPFTIGRAFIDDIGDGINKLDKSIHGDTEATIETLKDGTKDITGVISEFSANYQLSKAKENSLENLISASDIMGYGTQSDVNYYNSLSKRTQEQINQEVTNTRNKNKNNLSAYVWGDHRWYENIGHAVAMPFASVASAPVLGPLSALLTPASQINNFLKKEFAKEEYMKNALGYQKNESGVWIDPSTGEKINVKQVKKEIDTQEAIDAYNSGEYTTKNTLDAQIKRVRNIQELASDAGFNKTSQGYITEALMGSKEAINLLNTDEFKYYLQEQYSMSEQQAADAINQSNLEFLEKLDKETKQQIISEIQSWTAENATNSQLRLIEEAKAYTSALESQAEALGTTAEALDFYAIAMDNANGVTHKQNQETAEAAAAQYKFNKAYNAGRSTWEDNKELIQTYSRALKDNKKVSYDLADAMGDLSKSLKEMGLSLRGETITDNLELIEKLLTGTVEEAKAAYSELYKLSKLDALKNTFGDPAQLENGTEILKKYQEIINAIENSTPGANMAQSYADSLAKMITDTKLTAEQINTLADELGVEIPVHLNTPDDITFENAQWTTQAQSVQHSYNGQMPIPNGLGGYKLKTVQYAWTETIEPKTDNYLVPQGTKMKVVTNNHNLGQKTNFSISAANSKSKDTDKMEHEEIEIDRYHQVNTQITKVENKIKKLQSQTDKLVGSKWIDNLNKQWSQLNIQIDNYNEKLRIAAIEQNELYNKIKARGVTFNDDGTISNYTEALEGQVAYVNNLIDAYNKMSESQKEANKESVENAKTNLKQFQEDLDRYDELISDFIPGIQSELQDALDEQIDIQIQKFNKEIEFTLDMNQATRDWNAWVKRAVDGFDAEDIFGSAQARLKDFYTYFNEGLTGDAQVATKQVNALLEELQKMNSGQESVYGSQAAGYNTAQWLEDLKSHYTELMDSITGVIELQDELHQDWLDKMDEVQDKFSKQVEQYQFLSDIINHDIKLTQLIRGEDSYGELRKFYEAQQKNYEKQLDFQRQQKDFWYAQMQAAEEGTKEWDSAREKWKTAVSDFNSLLEESLQNAVDKFDNAIKDIFDSLNKSLTNGLGLDYVQTEWDLINKNADKYLDTINATYAIRELEKKYIDSINNSDMVSVQQRLQKVMEEQLASLKEKERLTQYDIDRANKLYEIELARIALEEAQKNKSQMRLRRDSQGNYSYQYVADDDAISEAENQLAQLYNELYNFDKDRYNETLNSIYESWVEYQEAMAEAALINDPELRAEKEQLIQEQYNELMVQNEFDYQTAKYNLQESFFQDWVNLNDMTLDQFRNLTDNEKDIIMTEFVPTWKNGISEMAEIFSGPGGFAETTQQAWYDIKDAENQYAQDMETLETISGQTFDSIIAGEDESLIKGQELIKQNAELISAYGQELEAVKNCYEGVKQLRDMFKEQEEAAIKSAEASRKAYEEATKAIQQEYALQRAQEKTRQTAAQQKTPTTKGYSSDTFSSGNGGNNFDGGYQDNTDSSSSSDGEYYTIHLIDEYWGGGSTTQRVAKGQYVYLPIRISKNKNYAFRGWEIPSKGITTEGGGTYKATCNENVVAKYTKITLSERLAAVGESKNLAYGLIYKDYNAGTYKSYDTGGYTGEWDSSGKVAMLHQKELVLNQQDTKNMLNAVALTRSMAYSLGTNVLAKLAGVSANGINGGVSAGTALEQNVHIDATFPNVRNAAEIEEALNNLTNAASQRIMENR